MLTAEALAEWLPAPGTAAVCAVSGGLDSMCLLHVLWQWCGERGVPLTAVHFHHGLRDTADRDEAFVRDWCAVREIPFTAGRGDVRTYAAENGLSVEEAARELRYRFLRETSRKNANAAIYTAHHAGDDAETILLNLIRGTGIRGLAGMRHRREGIVRPFLDVARPELEKYAAAHGIPHVEDETNANPSAAVRNRVRLELLPLLRELNPKAEEHIRETADQLREIDDYLEAEARRRMASASARRPAAALEIRDGRAVFPRAVLLDAPPCVRPRMLLLALEGMGAGRKDFGAVHLDAVLSLPGEDSGGVRSKRGYDGRERHLDLPHGVTARYARGLLILERRPPEQSLRTMAEAELLPGVPVQWGRYRVTLLDAHSGGEMPENAVSGAGCQGDCLVLRDGPERLTLSRARPADRLRLDGAGGSRTVKRLCLDRRISLEERDGLPAVYADGRLAAVWRLGTDVSFLPADGAEFSAGSGGGVQGEARRILVEEGEKKF